MTDPFGFPPEFLGKVPFFAELQRLLAWSGGPINWDLATQIATATAGASEGAGAKAIDRETADAAADLARRFIGDALGSELATETPRLLGAVAWVSDAPALLGPFLEPIAARSSRTDGLGDLPMPDGIPQEELQRALAAAGPLMFGFQLGGVIGSAAGVINGWHDLGIIPTERAVELLPASVGRQIRTAGIDEREGLLAALLMSIAAGEVVARATTLRARYFAAYLDIVAALEIDLAGAAGQLENLSDPSAIMGMMEQGFSIEPGPEAERARMHAAEIDALFVASVDQLAEAAAARAGLAPTVLHAMRTARTSDEVTALRASMALPPVSDTEAKPFVTAVVAEGGFDLLAIAWDDPMLFPTSEDLHNPLRWSERVR